MSQVPQGWIISTVGDLIELNPKNEASDDAQVGFVPMPLMATNFRETIRYEEKKWGEVKKGYTHFANGDVLLAKITPCFENGKAGVAEDLPSGIGAGSTEYFVCRSKRGAVLSRYLLAFFKTQDFLRAGEVNMTGSVGHKRVPKDFLLKSNIPLAPLAEQKRIVDKLDALLARVDATRARLDRIPTLLKRFRQSVLAAATSGQLTEDWRQNNPAVSTDDLKKICKDRFENWREVYGKRKFCEPLGVAQGAHEEIPENWSFVSLDAVAAIHHGFAFESKDFGEAGPVVLTPGNFTEDGTLDFESKRVVRISGNYEKCWELANGSLLVVMTDLSNKKLILGKTVILNCREKVLHNQRIGHVVPYSKAVSKEYLRFAMLRPAFKKYVDETASGTLIQHTSPTRLGSGGIPLPSLEEQRAIVRRVEALLGFADRLEAHYRAARNQLDRLIPALLAKAFRGELVPQDPNDEPADQLLARIRASAPEKARPKKSSKKTESA